MTRCQVTLGSVATQELWIRRKSEIAAIRWPQRYAILIRFVGNNGVVDEDGIACEPGSVPAACGVSSRSSFDISRVDMGAVGGDPRRLSSASGSPESSDAIADVSAGKLNRSHELAEICRHHHAALVRFLSVRAGSVENAKEILQEAYAKVLAIERPVTIKQLAGYVWRTAVNLAMDRGRERSRERRFARFTLPLAESQGLSVESTLELQQRLAIVDRAISDLPPRCLQAFVLHVLDGLTFEAVGREMRISARMAQKHLARALQHLRSCLDAADRTGGERRLGDDGLRLSRGS